MGVVTASEYSESLFGVGILVVFGVDGSWWFGMGVISYDVVCSW